MRAHHPRMPLSEHDARTLSTVMQEQRVLLEAEQFTHDDYLDHMILKPWGHEARIYADNLYDIWQLYLLPGTQTSLHCHPRKETALLCLHGVAKVQFLTTTYIVRAGESIHIGKGVCHCTSNIGPGDLALIEVETPRNKLDLVRIADTYRRSHTPYEKTPSSIDEPMYAGTLIEGSKFRQRCVHYRYRFELRTGRDMLQSPSAPDLFLISLGIQDAVQQHIRVFSSETPQKIDPSLCYFIVIDEKGA